MFGLPGRSYRGPFLPLTADEAAVREQLARHVEALSGVIGERNVGHARALARAAEYIERTFGQCGLAARSQEYSVSSTPVRNIDAELPGTTDEVLLIGAHYDSFIGCPGANDNATGVASLLELARLFTEADESPGSSRIPAKRTIRFAAFVNEEPPFFMTDQMGSLVYARGCRERGEKIYGMFSLETIGYYSDERRTQRYPASPLFQLLYPDTGNFVGFVSNMASRRLLREAGREFRRSTQFPSEGAAAPSDMPGVGWSDHWSFWQQGYPAVMITDTAPYRYPHYHQPTDTPDKVNYDALARLVCGLSLTFSALAKL